MTVSASTLLATVGTSLLPKEETLDLRQLSKRLSALEWSDPQSGAELNSLHLLQRAGHITIDCHIHYFLSDTPEGELVGKALQNQIGAERVHLHKVPGLDPRNPLEFAKKGLPNLAAAQCRVVHGLEHGYCALDATGGFKAQSAIAVTLGQALQIPVYYRHERFQQIIALPPLPVALDTVLWLDNASLFFDIAEDPTTYPELPKNPRIQSLIDWMHEDDEYLIGLNSTGVIFHHAMMLRWPEQSQLQLPKPADKKFSPTLTEHGWPDRQRVLDTMQQITDTVPYVTKCVTTYLNQDLSRPSTFLLRGEEIEALCSDGTHTVRFKILTTAQNSTQRGACLADLLLRLHDNPKLLW